MITLPISGKLLQCCNIQPAPKRNICNYIVGKFNALGERWISMEWSCFLLLPAGCGTLFSTLKYYCVYGCILLTIYNHNILTALVFSKSRFLSVTQKADMWWLLLIIYSVLLCYRTLWVNPNYYYNFQISSLYHSTHLGHFPWIFSPSGSWKLATMSQTQQYFSVEWLNAKHN